MKRPTETDAFLACRLSGGKFSGAKRKQAIQFAHEYFDANIDGTPTSCRAAGKREGIDPVLMYLIAKIVWELWKAWRKWKDDK